MKTKHCKYCNTTKEVTEFYIQRRKNRVARQGRCKECSKARYRENIDYFKDKARKSYEGIKVDPYVYLSTVNGMEYYGMTCLPISRRLHVHVNSPCCTGLGKYLRDNNIPVTDVVTVVLSTHKSREEAQAAEGKLLRLHVGEPTCLNILSSTK